MAYNILVRETARMANDAPVVGLIFIAVPMLELALLIKIGQWIGVWAPLGARRCHGDYRHSDYFPAGLQRSCAGRRRRGEGRPPVAPVLDGLFLMLAGSS